jgi:hypothetical protein
MSLHSAESKARHANVHMKQRTLLTWDGTVVTALSGSSRPTLSISMEDATHKYLEAKRIPKRTGNAPMASILPSGSGGLARKVPFDVHEGPFRSLERLPRGASPSTVPQSL